MITLGRLAIVVGHDKFNPGARAVYPISQYEYHYNTEIAGLMDFMAKEYQLQTRIFFRNSGLVKAYEAVNAWAENTLCVAIELHFNSSEDRRAKGTETLYDDPQSQILATLIQGSVLIAFKRTIEQNRKTVLIKEGDRGHRNLALAKCPSVIVEPFFGSNKEDAELGHTLKKEYAECLLIATKLYFRQTQRLS